MRKASLVLCDIEDITFKVDNFNSKNMLKIESEWDDQQFWLQP